MTKLPESWEKVKLGDLGEFKTSNVDKKIKEEEIPVKLINYMDVYRHNFITKKLELMNVTANRHQFVTNKVMKGDVLFTPTSETPDDIGHSAVVLEDIENTLYSYHLIRLRFKNHDLMDIKFKGYVFNSRIVLHQFEILATGVTRFTLSKEDFKEITVIYPVSLIEQRKIAEILETIDNAIEKTDKIIEKYKRIKQGLMQELLTKGIDENGQIRNEKTHKFKDSPLGRIPEEWEVVRLGDIAKVKRGASPRPIDDPIYFSEKGRGWVRILDVTSSNKYLERTTQYLSLLGETKSVKVEPNELIMSICATVGKPIIVKIPACIHDGFVSFKNLSTQVDVEYLFYYLTFKEKHIQEMGQIGTQGNLNSNLVSSFMFLKPPLPEQKRIASILSQIDKVIEKEQKFRKKLERIKQGLMEDLLTGKVGVNCLISGGNLK